MRMGIVAIGRNEGTRLQACLESLLQYALPLVYVDSNSTDDSVALAKKLGVPTFELDPAKPCCASRARREGFRHLMHDHPDLDTIFFVDGDCQVDPNWLHSAHQFLQDHPEVGAVCGRRREQHPEQSVYNRLCDEEWNTPVGEALSVGGDAVYRCEAYRQAGEFNPTVPAGEEPELCKRMRDCGWKIWRLDEEMTIHNADMTQFSQWWQRQVRTGYAGCDVERRFSLGIFDRINKSAFLWALIIPLLGILTAIFLGWQLSSDWALGCLFLTGLLLLTQTLRIALRKRSHQRRWSDSLQFGFFTMLAKVPISLGAIRQILESSLGKQAQLIEYKSAEDLHPQA